jgi:hypothetical protein
MRVEFHQKGTWAALRAARTWCQQHGLSIGQSCAVGPSGLLFGSYAWIAKWRNLTPKEQAELHGTLSGEFREGPVVVSLKDEAVKQHCPALLGADIATNTY